MPPAGCFREEVEIMVEKYFITDVGGTTNTTQAQSRNMIKICTKYEFDSFIISGSYGGHRGHTTDNVRRKTARGMA